MITFYNEDNQLIKICLLVLIINPMKGFTNLSMYLEFIGHEG